MGFPDWLEPMAATLTHERFSGPDWVFERKLDGIRLLAYYDGIDVRLFSRTRRRRDAAHPGVARAIAELPVRSVILDGEATGAWGRQGEADYYVFDILWLNGQNITTLPLDARRELLATVPFQGPVARVRPLEHARPWERACAQGWEGVIAKRRDAPYEHRRSKAWLKMKCEATQELAVGGFTEPRGSRVGLGALLVGHYDRDDFVFAGRVGTGFDAQTLLHLRARLDALEIERPPFTRGGGLPRVRAHWTRPEIVVQVAFTEWTVHGKLRHPRFLGVRNDKRARDVVREST